MTENSKRHFKGIVENAYLTLKYSMWMKDLLNNKITFGDLKECLNFESQLYRSDSLNWKEVEVHVDNFFHFKKSHRDSLLSYSNMSNKSSKSTSTKMKSFENKKKATSVPVITRKTIKSINKTKSELNTSLPLEPECIKINATNIIECSTTKSKTSVNKKSSTTSKKEIENQPIASERKSKKTKDISRPELNTELGIMPTTSTKTLSTFNLQEKMHKSKNIKNKSRSSRKKLVKSKQEIENQTISSRRESSKSKDISKTVLNEELEMLLPVDALSFFNLHEKMHKSNNIKNKAKSFTKKRPSRLPLYARKKLNAANMSELNARPSLVKEFKQIKEKTKNFFQTSNGQRQYKLEDYKDFLIRLYNVCKTDEDFQHQKEKDTAWTLRPPGKYKAKKPIAMREKRIENNKSKKRDCALKAFNKKPKRKGVPLKNKEQPIKRGLKRRQTNSFKDFSESEEDYLFDENYEDRSLVSNLKRRRVSSTVKIPWR